MKDRFNDMPECKLPPIKNDAVFVCYSIEKQSGSEPQVHIIFQEITEEGLIPVFHSCYFKTSTIKKNKSFFNSLQRGRFPFYEIKSIERFNNKE